ncbi:hypothetical protein [Streptomyces sp. NPDC094437]|uniref:hypothetical protein n=1 Tax=Streptomyces sp. NPDC094437 TaxID=3366060 RepID=UPI0038109008
MRREYSENRLLSRAGPLNVLGHPDSVSSVVEILHVREGDEPEGVAGQSVARWLVDAWPAGLLSLNCFISFDRTTVCVMGQWSSHHSLLRTVRHLGNGAESGAVRCDEGLRGLSAVRYRVYQRVGAPVREHPVREQCGTGCVNVVVRPMPDRSFAKRWIDAVLDRYREISEAPLWREGSFHISADGRSVLIYSEWDSKGVHDLHMETMRRELGDLFAGLPEPRSAQQYTHHRSLNAVISAPACDS